MPQLLPPSAADIDALPAWLALWPWAEAALILFGFAWGSLLGSFLNVVVHRLPLGESVAGDRSRCPHCRQPIRARDNLPVIGWLLLRGRCRSCAAGISPAYPLVEGLCGVVVAGIVAAELTTGGRWLPRPPTGFPQGVDRLLRGDWSLLLTCCLHAGVILTVVTWALLDRVGWKCPPTWLAVGLGLAVAAVAIAPSAAPPGLLPDGGGWPPGPDAVQRVAASLTGAAVGGLLGLSRQANSLRLGLPLLGSVLGWQSLTVVTVATALAAKILPKSGKSSHDAANFGLGLAATGGAALAGHAGVLAVWGPAGAALLAALTTG